MVNVHPSDVVKSLAGRDSGKLFFVFETDGEYAVLTDGKTRKRETPKRKKMRHIELIAKGDAAFDERLRTASNSEIRKALAAFQRLRD